MDDLGKLASSEQRKQRLVVFGVVGTLILAGSLFQVERALLPDGRGAAAFAAMPLPVQVAATADLPVAGVAGRPGRIPIFRSTSGGGPADTTGYDYTAPTGAGGPLLGAPGAAATTDTPVQLAAVDPSGAVFGGGVPDGSTTGSTGGGGGGGGIATPGGGGGGGGGGGVTTPGDGTTPPGGGSSTDPGDGTTIPPGGGTTDPGGGTTVPGGGTIPSVPAGVPEPATWALMLLGFGAVAATMRRRSSVARRTTADFDAIALQRDPAQLRQRILPQ